MKGKLFYPLKICCTMYGQSLFLIKWWFFKMKHIYWTYHDHLLWKIKKTFCNLSSSDDLIIVFFFIERLKKRRNRTTKKGYFILKKNRLDLKIKDLKNWEFIIFAKTNVSMSEYSQTAKQAAQPLWILAAPLEANANSQQMFCTVMHIIYLLQFFTNLTPNKVVKEHDLLLKEFFLMVYANC